MAKLTTVESTPHHLTDSILQPFLQRDFDPADYLNTALPTLAVSTTRPTHLAVPLSELNSQLQALLIQLNAQTTRLSNTLNQLTDEIIRSGARLAYEVEVLHGETTGLADTLENELKEDIGLFVASPGPSPAKGGVEAVEDGDEGEDGGGGKDDKDGKDGAAVHGPAEPEYMQRLRMLTAVRSRLDSVIQVFGDAMAWPLAPSEFAGVASSFISVSAPETDAEMRDREEKGKAYAEALRTEINNLIGPGDDPEGLGAAMRRIEELRRLAEVWKGTAEEKARVKFVDALAKPVEERRKALEKAGQASRKVAVSPPPRGGDLRYGNLDTRAVTEGGYGFLQNLRNLRNDLYVE